ncbi:Acyl-CoA dehydrogenase, short-chain specific [Serratia rubidaea]|nr:acyl-CoA dehydrogenase [Serratia rubidaea]CAI0732432.1 Acyl-CoA dehydrogenase, short-chain specific [Serratia rubidaea]CAI1538995.1 Acyl-CoA dehydrogenase, short-chain specific [Serratia rubidaea]
MEKLLQALAPVHAAPLSAEDAADRRQEAEQACNRERLMQQDNDAAFPAETVAWLNRQGAQLLYLPAQHGGKLRGLEQITQLWRALAGIDLTVAIGHGKTFLGAVCVWLGGTPQQIAQIRQALLAHEPLAWGLTERGRGADLMATQTTATRQASGWRLQGEKWLINNATRGHIITVLANTGDAPGGARNLSVLLVDTRRLPPGCWRHLDKVNTYGIRGADISGQRWQDAPLPAEALVGEAGQGLELTLRALQLTRTACCGLSVGALDAGIKLTLELVQQHRLYGRRMIELDTVQTLLAESTTVAWLSEVTAWVAARHAGYLPQEMSVISALAKAAIPSLVAQQLTRLEEQMGARGFVSDLYAGGAFQKLIRDHQIVPIFDGSTIVNRVALVPQLPTLIRHFKKGTADLAALDQLAQLDAPQPEALPLASLTIFSRNGCSLVQALPALIERLQQRHAEAAEDMGLNALLGELLRVSRQTVDELAAAPLAWPAVPQPVLQGLQRYEWLFIAACCLLFWLNNPALQHAPGRRRHWLPLCLHLIARHLDLAAGPEQHAAWPSLKQSFAEHPCGDDDTLLSQGAHHER